ncbi:chorismate synthase [Clostridium sp. SYSU_GA19001]|uniref:chorismate synthase n=1 Tax=Clostridium caldaquaticum TaxID=2940653 RepID=UPI002076DB80|nr:chorismate synthase [Clostridium caldaquaticum]MCM8711600.1 chorismate synthase [Clostridium caldaquaticum]
MSGVWGQRIKFSIFGESHGKGIGITIDGLPSGIKLDLEEIQFEMGRRAPGKNEFSTPRNEKDSFEILSGYFNESTTGTPLCAVIWNKDQHSKDYSELKNAMRPGHADYTGFIKYKGFNDYRGGGHFSGRLTAPLVFAGAIAKQILAEKDIYIGSHIYQIGNIYDTPFDKVNIELTSLKELHKKSFPVINEQKEEEMKNAILEAKKNLDSVGGVIEAAAINLPAGLGSPFFDSVESTLAHLLFSIPAVKGVEFGAGFSISSLRGSQANDEFYIENGKVQTLTNNNGGILGGITNGMPLIFKAAFKPTPSIGKPQKTVNISKMENTELEVRGRHDPCIVQRAIPVVEAVTAMAVLDLLYSN